MEIKNYGFSLELEKAHVQKEDWQYLAGISETCIALIPEGERMKYLPKGEVQRGLEDFMDCASRGPLNIIETKLNYLVQNDLLPQETIEWLADNDYLTESGVELSDAFIAILSGTTDKGNSMKAPINAIHEFGVIPKRMLPALPSMTFADYHDPNRITWQMRKMGQDFKSRIKINYEQVKWQDYDVLLKEDLLSIAGFAWTYPVDGEYPKTEATPNHVFIDIAHPLHTIFDNYIDSVDGDFIKKLVYDYNFLGYGYRMYLSLGKLNEIKKKSCFKTFLEAFKNWG